MADSKVVICPYCGAAQTASRRCGACKADFGPLSMRATRNQMGPWFVRDEEQPFRPGCSYEAVVKMIDAGELSRYSIVRGPTTSQLWTVARKVPGVAHLLGDCHNCNEKIEEGVTRCPGCGTVFGAWLDRNHMGLPDIRPMPGEPGADLVDEDDQGILHGFRPLASDGLSAFVHVEKTHAETSSASSGEGHVQDEARGAEDGSDQRATAADPSSIFDQAMRAELALARRHASRMTILAVLALVAAAGTLLFGILLRSNTQTPAASDSQGIEIDGSDASETAAASPSDRP